MIELKEYFKHSGDIIKVLGNHAYVIQQMAKGIHDCFLNGGKLLIVGNGGSCSDAEHMACELTCTFQTNRRAFCAINLATSLSSITAWSNDFDFDSYFVRQVEALGKPDDILFLISTGGGDEQVSFNLIQAASSARCRNMNIYSLVGKTGGELSKISDVCLIVPSFETPHIQEAHIAIIHAICMEIDRLEVK